jgi:hypothetical protein
MIFLDWVKGTPIFGGMSGRALAVILKLNFWKSCNHKKSFITSERVRKLTGYLVQSEEILGVLITGKSFTARPDKLIGNWYAFDLKIWYVIGMQFDRYIGQTPIKNLHIPRSNKISKISNRDQDQFFLICLHLLIWKFEIF